MDIDQSLEEIERAGRLRRLLTLTPDSPVYSEYMSKGLILFSSNDYLGLSSNGEVKAAVSEVVQRSGMGCRSAALISGYSSYHEELESRLARLKETESALLFPTGYMTNLGVLQALGSEDTEIFSDELNHASIIDGCRLSRSKISVYRHCDTNHLESLVKSSTAESKLVITESVFSMDGDLAPLRELCEIKSRYNFMLVVDEAHATLVYGPKGRGLSHQLGVSEAIDIQVGTLSKAVGSIGGFVALSSKLKSYLINRARAYIFTTSLPIPNVVASLKAVEVATRDELLRERLWQNIEAFSDRLNLAAYGPIIPILLGSEQMATRASEQLMAEGFHVPAIRPPTVPPGTSRLRITLSSEHLPEHLDQLSELIEKIQA